MTQILASGKTGAQRYENASLIKPVSALDIIEISQQSQRAYEETQGYSLSNNEGSADSQNEDLSIIESTDVGDYDASLAKLIQTYVANNSYLDVDAASTANSIILVPRKIADINSPDGVNYAKTTSLPFAFRDNLTFIFRATIANTGATQISIPALSGLSGSVDLVDEGGAALIGGEITVGRFYEVVTTGTATTKEFILKRPTVGVASTSASGVIEIASDAEAIAESDTTRAIVPSSLAAWDGAKNYVSSPQAMTLSAQTVLAHGLGAQPRSVQIWLQCVTAQLGYTVGQQVQVNPAINDSSDTTTSRGFSIIADATNITVKVGASAIVIINASTGGAVGITTANWNFVIKAKK